MLTDVRDITMLPEQERTVWVPVGAEVVGITHDRPFAHLRLKATIDDSPYTFMETRTFRAVLYEDREYFDTSGWTHVATTLIGGEEPGDTWMTIHVWEKK